jgi:glucose/arabinose dehydrogenase
MARSCLLLAGLFGLAACQSSGAPDATQARTAAAGSADALEPERSGLVVRGNARAPRGVRSATAAAAAGTAPATSTAAAPDAAPVAQSSTARAWVLGGPHPPQTSSGLPFVVTAMARFNEPWAMAFLPDRRLLVTEKSGRLRLFNPATGAVGEVTGVPPVAYGGQGGLGDVVVHRGFANNGWVYLSYAEAGANDTRGAAVLRARLVFSGTGGSLVEPQVIWRQSPKVTGYNHYSHRMAFDRAGMLWITSGDRQKQDPAQDLQSNLGKVLRLHADGSVPADNPFAAQGGRAAQVWSLGHRNLLGIAFDAQGRLWTHEMGPRGGDELNLIERGANYGWPIVSNGDHYDGTPIPDHPTRPEFNAPEDWWTPVIAPAGFVIYSGVLFPHFRGQGFIGGLASQALVRVEFDGVRGAEATRYAMGRRIREVEQGPEGALWLLEDGADGRLLKLTPR